ncbi:TlpA family protein disulfide reductase [Phenylobacterium sp.]|uniref:TlpA family protein disulfide reductase n=1 Tax=Phenylobacterium sp. TaxID=1871053 RepID=UPI0035AD7A57
MSEHPTAKPKPDMLKWGLWGAALLGVAAVVYIIVQASTNPAHSDLKALAKGEMSKLTFSADAGAPPADSFLDADGKRLRLADLKGKVLVVNLWATWCAPCRLEMPTLAKLAAEYQGKPVEVVAISIDKGDDDQAKARAFIAQNAPLKFYIDPAAKLPFDLKPQAVGMPTTVIYGADGIERARLSGGADWSGPDAKALIDKVLDEG